MIIKYINSLITASAKAILVSCVRHLIEAVTNVYDQKAEKNMNVNNRKGLILALINVRDLYNLQNVS